MASALDFLSALARLMAGRVDSSATRLRAFNAVLVDGTTARTIAAAPGAGKSHFIKKIRYENITPAEAPIVTIRASGTTAPLVQAGVGTAFNNGGILEQVFDPPIMVGDNKAIEGLAHAALGDTAITVHGVTGPTTIVDEADPLEALSLISAGPLPDDAVPFTATNATEVDDTTARSLIGPPGVGKRYYITEVIIANRTPAELATITVRSSVTQNSIHTQVAASAVGNGGYARVKLQRPLPVGENEGIEALAAAALGDTKVIVNGFVGSVLS